MTRLLSAALCLFVAVPRAHAQVLYGSIVGDVTDQGHASVPGATVRLVQRETNQSRETTTSTTGGYSFTTLPAGTYDLTIVMDGFETINRRGVWVAVDQVLRIDATLVVGAVSEQLEVRAQAPVLQTDRAEVRSEITTKSLENIPIPTDRNYQNLLVMVPGFTPPVNAHSVAVNPSRGLQFEVNGATGNANNIRIDGASVANVWLPHVTAYVPALEAISDVSVVTSSFDAEQGLTGGAAVNVQIKSGTNQLHGSTFEYHTDDGLKSAPYFLPAGQSKPKTIDNQTGGTVGGPIKQNKLFFFGSYEGVFDRQTATLLNQTIPTLAMRIGDLSQSPAAIYDPLTGNPDGTGRTPFVASSNPGSPNYSPACANPAGCPNIIPLARLDPTVQKLLALLPAPQNPAAIANNYFATGAYNVTRHKIDGKINWNASNRLQVSGRLGWLNYDFVDPPAFGALVGPPVSSAGGKVGEGFGNVYSTTFSGSYIASPTFVVDSYFGWTRMDTNQEPPRLNENLGLTFLGIPGTNGPSRLYGGWPAFNFGSDFAAIGNPGGGGSGGPILYADSNYQYTANATWIKSTHSVRFGVDVARQALNHFETTAAAGGFVFSGGTTALRAGASPNRFNTMASFLLGLPSELAKNLLPFDDDLKTSRSWEYSLYVRDQWQALRKLTLSYGLRWDYFPMGTRANRGMERYDFDTNQMMICGVGSVPTDCGYDINKTNFSPRLGIAWRPAEVLVVRAGYGINYDPYPLAFVRDLLTNYPEDLSLTVRGPNSFQPAGRLQDGIPSITPPDLSGGIIPVPATYETRSLPPHITRGYVESWNLTVQRELGWGFTGQVGYVASRQRQINQIFDLNAGQVLGAGSDGQPFKQRFGRTAATALLEPVGWNRYDSLQTRLDRRFRGGYQFHAAYTWSKTIGICCDILSDNPPRIQAVQYFYLNRAIMPFDRTHVFNASGIAELPFGKGRRWLSGDGLASTLADGWQASALFSAYAGLPFTVTSDNSSLNAPGNNQRADQVRPDVAILGGTGPGHPYFDPLAFAPVRNARFGTASYDSLRGPGIANLDLGLFRDFPLAGAWRLQLRLEALNVTNTPHFANPGSNVSNLQLNPDGTIKNLGGFSEITQTAGNGREGIDERVFRLGLRLSF